MTQRTYEGTVESYNDVNQYLEKGDPAIKAKQFEEDFKAGRISQQEYIQKMTELGSNQINIGDKFKVLVNAGFETIIRGTNAPTEPAKFNNDGNSWFEDKNFYSK